MKIIKIILALGIFSCLFLPLSQCTGVAGGHPESDEFESHEDVQESAQKDTQENYSSVHKVISSIDDAVDIDKTPIIIGFLFPLLFCIYFAKRKWHILALILQTLNQLWLIYLTLGLVWFFSEPLWGGWLLSFCVAAYSLITIIEWINLFRKNNPYNQHFVSCPAWVSK